MVIYVPTLKPCSYFFADIGTKCTENETVKHTIMSLVVAHEGGRICTKR